MGKLVDTPAGGRQPRHARDAALGELDFQRFIEAAKSPRERCYAHLLAHWGLRASEVAHFCFDWVARQRGVITIPKQCKCQACRESGKPFRTKTPNGHRSLPVHKHTETWEACKRFLEAYPTPEASQVSRQAVWKLVNRLAARAGLVDTVYPHALRATAATQLASMGLTDVQLCRAMGWSDIRVARPYVRVSAASLENALDDKDLKWW